MCSQCCFQFKDWLILSISLLFTAIWPFVLYILKPKLEIQNVEIQDKSGKCLAVTVANIGNSNAVNLHMDFCAKQGECTYHLDIDKNDFIILPKKKDKTKGNEHVRVFKAYNIASFAQKFWPGTFNEFLVALIQNNDPKFILRIRIHANHSFSGFGRAFERRFEYINGFQPMD